MGGATENHISTLDCQGYCYILAFVYGLLKTVLTENEFQLNETHMLQTLIVLGINAKVTITYHLSLLVDFNDSIAP